MPDVKTCFPACRPERKTGRKPGKPGHSGFGETLNGRPKGRLLGFPLEIDIRFFFRIRHLDFYLRIGSFGLVNAP